MWQEKSSVVSVVSMVSTLEHNDHIFGSEPPLASVKIIDRMLFIQGWHKDAMYPLLI